jgi:hypothetical protein
MERVNLPASPSLRAARVPRATTTHNGDAQISRKRALNGKPSGAQVSYWKARRTLAEEYRRDGYTWEAAVAKAERVLNPVLSTRQREQLDQRSERKAAA